MHLIYSTVQKHRIDTSIDIKAIRVQTVFRGKKEIKQPLESRVRLAQMSKSSDIRLELT